MNIEVSQPRKNAVQSTQTNHEEGEQPWVSVEVDLSYSGPVGIVMGRRGTISPLAEIRLDVEAARWISDLLELAAADVEKAEAEFRAKMPQKR
jgi:phosphopantetheinyl transferase